MAETREVYFDKYCQTCKHKDVEEKELPCRDCLYEPYNYDSHKPRKWESADGKSQYFHSL